MNQLDSTFAALADPTRRAILARLALGDAMVGELARPFAMSLPAISRHLGVLERASLIVRLREGKHRRVTLNAKVLGEANEWLEHYRQFWTDALERLDQHLASTKEETMTELAEPMLALDISRHFAAPPERVFDAWITPHWAQWMPPRAATCVLTLHEPRVGGRFETRMTMPDGRLVNTSGVYREIDRPFRLAFTWSADYAGFETLMTLTFAPEDGGTRMTLRQTGFPSPEARQGYESGWNGPGGSFDKLEAMLGTHTL